MRVGGGRGREEKCEEAEGGEEREGGRESARERGGERERDRERERERETLFRRHPVEVVSACLPSVRSLLHPTGGVQPGRRGAAPEMEDTTAPSQGAPSLLLPAF